MDINVGYLEEHTLLSECRTFIFHLGLFNIGLTTIRGASELHCGEVGESQILTARVRSTFNLQTVVRAVSW